MTYAERLRDPKWQKKRLEVMERDQWQCINCCDKKTTLNVHHCWYEKGVDVWDYPMECYQTLCEPCHKIAESTRLKLSKILFSSTPEDMAFIIKFVSGIKHEKLGEAFSYLDLNAFPILLGLDLWRPLGVEYALPFEQVDTYAIGNHSQNMPNNDESFKRFDELLTARRLAAGLDRLGRAIDG